MSYIVGHRLLLPKQYPELMSSIECWNCPAELTRERAAWLRRHYPERMPELRGMAAALQACVSEAIAKAAPGIDEILMATDELSGGHL